MNSQIDQINTDGEHSPHKGTAASSNYHKSTQGHHPNAKEISMMYKTQRYCNQVTVFKKFCKQAGTPSAWSKKNNHFERSSVLPDDINPIK